MPCDMRIVEQKKIHMWSDLIKKTLFPHKMSLGEVIIL